MLASRGSRGCRSWQPRKGTKPLVTVWVTTRLPINNGTQVYAAFLATTPGRTAAAKFGVTFDDVATSGRNYYFRWTMETRMKNLAKGKTIRTIGVTLVRFDREGRVILHQDFWDSAQGVWDHVPLIGPTIRWIQSQL